MSAQKLDRGVKVNRSYADQFTRMDARSIDFGSLKNSSFAAALTVGYDFYPSF
jgi:hypothetical protein